MLGEIKRHFRDKGWSVHVPRATQELVLKVGEALGDLPSRLGRSPTPRDVAAAVNAPVEDVLEAMEAATAYEAVSLDAPRPGAADEESWTLAESLSDEEHGYELVEIGETLRGTLEALPARERLILRLRFEEDLTQAEIAERVGVSQMHVSRLLRRSLDRLSAAGRGGCVAFESVAQELTSRPEVAALIARGEERGCINLSEFDELAQALELVDEDARRAREPSSRRRASTSPTTAAAAGVEPTTFRNGELAARHDRRAAAVPERDPPLPAAHRGRGGRALQADRAGRPGGEGAHDQLQPAPGGVDREEVPGPGAVAARPDPGGHLRPDPRGREVRLAQGLQVLDLRDLLDPPGDPARAGEQGAHDPHPGAHRPARAQDRPRRARAVGEARPRPERRRDRRARPSCRSTRSRRCATRRGPSRASTARWARRATPRSATCSRAARRRRTRRSR